MISNHIKGARILVILAFVITGLTIGMRAAPADACDITSHCYGIAYWPNSSTNYGSAGDIYFHCLYDGSPSNSFTDEEMWNGTNNSGNLAYWVEAGGAYGYPNGATRYWFWADNRPNGGLYHEHYPGGSISLNTFYKIEFLFEGSNTWNVMGPGWSQNSTSNPPAGKSLEAGTELESNDARSVGKIDSLEWFDTSYGSHAGWSGATLKDIGPGDYTSTSFPSDHTEVAWTTNNC
jgi:hypothetical protein